MPPPPLQQQPPNAGEPSAGLSDGAQTTAPAPGATDPAATAPTPATAGGALMGGAQGTPRAVGVEFENGNYKYRTTGADTVTLTGFSAVGTPSPATTVTVPATVTEGGTSYRVTRIGDKAFSSQEYVTGLDLSGATNLAVIEYGAFNGCQNLSTVTFCSDGVLTDLQGDAFFGTALTSITLPKSLASITPNVFSSCSKLTEILVAADNAAFSSINGVLLNKAGDTLLIAPPASTTLTAITATVFPGVQTIGDDAFQLCTWLQSVTLPDVTTVGARAFSRCNSLTTVDLPKAQSIGFDAFFSCTSLATVALPNAQSIGETAFKDCKSPFTLVLQTGTPPTAAANVFERIASVTVQVTPGTEGAYSGAPWTNAGVTITPVDPAWTYNPGASTLTHRDGHSLHSVTVSSGTSLTIGSGNSGYTNATLSILGPVLGTDGSLYTVTQLAKEAFIEPGYSSSAALESVALPTVTQIGYRAFRGCTLLTSLTLPALQSLGPRAFDLCDSLTTVSLPAGLRTVGENPFVGCRNLTAIAVDPANQWFSSYNGLLLDKAQTTLLCAPAANGLTAVTAADLPATVTALGPSAFYGHTTLTSVALPKVTHIESNAFQFCRALASVQLPAATSVGDTAFQYCTALTTAGLPRVAQLAQNAFAFTGLTTLYFHTDTPPTAATGVNSPFYQVTGPITLYVKAGTAPLYNVAPWNGNAPQFNKQEYVPPVINTATLPNGTSNAAYAQALQATEGTPVPHAPLLWSVSAGALPSGLALAPTGQLTGTPTQAGTFTFTVSVTHDGFAPTTKQLTLAIGGSATAPATTPAPRPAVPNTGSPNTPALLLLLAASGGTLCLCARKRKRSNG